MTLLTRRLSSGIVFRRRRLRRSRCWPFLEVAFFEGGGFSAGGVGRFLGDVDLGLAGVEVACISAVGGGRRWPFLEEADSVQAEVFLVAAVSAQAEVA